MCVFIYIHPDFYFKFLTWKHRFSSFLKENTVNERHGGVFAVVKSKHLTCCIPLVKLPNKANDTPSIREFDIGRGVSMLTLWWQITTPCIIVILFHLMCVLLGECVLDMLALYLFWYDLFLYQFLLSNTCDMSPHIMCIWSAFSNSYNDNL